MKQQIKYLLYKEKDSRSKATRTEQILKIQLKPNREINRKDASINNRQSRILGKEAKMANRISENI